MLKKIVRKIIDLVISLICIVAMAFICLLLMGIRPYVVMSGSMGDAIPVGSLCFVDTKYDYDEVEVGDVIAYASGKVRVTHRVYEISNGLIRTKGDANEKPDMYFISEEHFLGLTKYCLPDVGYAVNWVQSSRGKILVGTAAICLILLNFMVEDDKEKKKGKKKKLDNQVD